ncbi:MAG: YkgJ family cysteine cluster protein [Candidatus Marinimicrobia bacterium]|nr:YkgJ family cysteine cluster protein [Candidatus Neomarinimicrobiota bacterium]
MNYPDRIHYIHEVDNPWLTNLLDSYAVCDRELEKEVAREEKSRGVKVACAKGCYYCCLTHDIPVSALEALGISWYLNRIMDTALREMLLERFRQQEGYSGCPFLADGTCQVYPVRPLACRQFLVYETQCKPDDSDPFFSRPRDMHPRDSSRLFKVAMHLLDNPVYNLADDKEKIAAYRDGIMHKSIPGMHEIDWVGFSEMTAGQLF